MRVLLSMHCRVLVVALLMVATLPTSAFAQWGRGGSAYRADIDALGSTPVATLSIPVLLGIELSDLTKNFGDPRGDGTRLHEGLDMVAPEGTPIATPTDAVVTRVGNGASSGLYVRTANPGGETFVYMHLAAIAEGLAAGDVLKRGDIIGFVGNRGNASGGPAHLHFEIRKGSALDPHPRLTQVFSLAERMQGVAQALERGGAPYANAWATHFADVFRAAQAQGLTVPPSILALLGSAPSVDADVPATDAQNVRGTLVFGENNSDVIALQKFLIGAETGPASAYLARSGATGYFGAITQAALIEYQRAAGLSASGVVDDATYTQIFALSGEGDSSETEPEEESLGERAPVSGFAFTRDLELGMRGEDVRELQKFLNTNGFQVAASAEGSPGQETTYFGSLTREALARYQVANGIAPSVGYFGPITRASFAAFGK